MFPAYTIRGKRGTYSDREGKTERRKKRVLRGDFYNTIKSLGPGLSKDWGEKRQKHQGTENLHPVWEKPSRTNKLPGRGDGKKKGLYA